MLVIVYIKLGFYIILLYLKLVICKRGFGKDTVIDKLREMNSGLKVLLI